jgi:hypothetical protein
MIREAVSYTLVLMALVPLSLDKVAVHVEKQEVKGLTKVQCEQAKREARREGVKAACVREDRTYVKN